MFVVSSSVIPKIAPTANTPAAMLNTASRVRVLLCHRSNQILYQSTPISGLRFPEFEIFARVFVGGLLQRLARGLGLAEQFIQLIVAEGQHLDRTAFGGADRSPALAVVEEGDLARMLSGTQLQRHHVGRGGT